MAWSIFQQDPSGGMAVSWAKQFLSMIGAPQTPGNVQFVYQWEKSEGGGGQFNPLNVGPLSGHTDLLVPGDTGSHFGGGAADYNSWQSGLLGAMYGVQLPAYKGVLDNLKANNPSAARSALWASPWAASHYGFGHNWFSGTIPNGTQNLPPLNTSTAPTSGGGSTATAASDVTGSTCAWQLNFGPVNGCVVSYDQVGELISFPIFMFGTMIVVIGMAFLVVAGFRNTKVNKQAQSIIYLVPGARKLERYAGANYGSA